MAMAPNPFEGNKYNLLNDFGDQFVRTFDPRGVTAFWAPVFAPAKAAQADSDDPGPSIEGLMGDARAPWSLRRRLSSKHS